MAELSSTAGEPPRILIVGGGYVGMYTALGLQSKLRQGEASVTVVDPQPQMTYQPFLPEAAAGSIEPRHVVVPLRRVLRRCHIVCGRVTGVDHTHRFATIENCAGHIEQRGYDVLVMAPGSIARTLPIPGLAEHGIAFKTIGEAIYLRNHVLARLEAADATIDQQLRRKLLSFLVVGGGYAGIEVLAELEDMARYACRYYETIEPQDMRWVLVEATGRIMPEVSPKMGRYTAMRLIERGIEIFLNTRVTTMENGHVVLDDGTEFDTDTIVWTAGVKANPVLQQTDLPLDDRKRLRCTATLQVVDCPNAFSAGDCAAVPDLTSDDPNATCVSARPAAAVLQAPVRGVGGQPGSVPRGGRDLRDQGQGRRGLVLAPHLPPEPDADLQPQGSHRDRLDRRLTVSPRGGGAGPDQRPESRVRPRHHHVVIRSGQRGYAAVAPP
jgi:NADH:quinone reductase (non-electrogenic)